MSMRYLFLGILSFFLYSCIGTDIIDDLVEPRITLANRIEAMIVADDYQFQALYFNNIGVEQQAFFEWISSNPDVLEISESGLASAFTSGVSTITFTANDLSSSFSISVFHPDEVNADSIRMAQLLNSERTADLVSVSSYQLEGTATLRPGSKLQIVLSDDFETTDVLPGLYLYLTNNPNTINNALEIGVVKEFSGGQIYDVPEMIRLQDYSHILFYCKPFVVAVGQGKFEP